MDVSTRWRQELDLTLRDSQRSGRMMICCALHFLAQGR
jgi:hypothetical protein